jgi:hypothetical protein
MRCVHVHAYASSRAEIGRRVSAAHPALEPASWAQPHSPWATALYAVLTVGAIRTCMGSVGAMNIRELQQTELIIAPSIKTEGKVFQRAQKLGTPR